MGGIFGAVSKTDCVTDLFFGIDYHSHLGTRRGGMAVYSENKGFMRAIHNIENSPFRTKFERDVLEMKGNIGIGCISDNEPQPLIVRSHLGNYAITTVGRINNEQELVNLSFEQGSSHFLEMSGGKINATELVASLINQKATITEGIQYAQEIIDGSITILILTSEGIYGARDKMGRTPLIIGKKENAFCLSFESFAYLNLGYRDKKELGPGEIVYVTPDGIKIKKAAQKKMKICAFLWTYYGYPTSCYEGVNVEQMRYNCGKILAKDDHVDIDFVAGVPDSGTAHAIGYANESGIPFARPFIKYTPTWPRSFMPTNQSMRNLVAHMKLIPVDSLIRDKKLLFIDDSVVRGTQMRETVEFLYECGAKEVHIRPACPPIMYGCKYLNFSRSTSEMDLITRRVIKELEGENHENAVSEYIEAGSEKYNKMIDMICQKLNFTSLKYQTLDGMLDAIGIDKSQICTYCWNGKE
ncbi:amidophosphoribosyltransferase [Paludicola sp. MB14-C6]|uniref:amidophosphoribosyltransferase n=1 Tax=Paludihabitans sp. MB14-C6 TaxID=3070656 RepID=UPI0027DCD63A|nr:amidophosphoribosyltransferase [Paludicola sp. MB14-C6]WMJ21850.1 amidophosphoribosyltransferase [Paludicola sp. MB14-C6]